MKKVKGQNVKGTPCMLKLVFSAMAVSTFLEMLIGITA